MRRELIEDLSAKSKKLDRLQSSFIERASKIPCIVTFREVNKVYSHLVSVSPFESFTSMYGLGRV